MEVNVFGNYRCPCCKSYTYERKANNTYQICSVCFWEDDGVQLDNPEYEGGANTISLNEARKNFKIFGAMDERFIGNVRPPLKEEKHITRLDGRSGTSPS